MLPTASTTMERFSLLLLLLASTSQLVSGYVPSIAPELATPWRTNPFKTEGLDIELPDFDHLFDKITTVSPLAHSVMQRTHVGKGLDGIADHSSPFKWKKVESGPRSRTVHSIDKVDNFEGKSAPLFRFRSTLKGPCVGEYFGKYIVDVVERRKWDSQVDHVEELYPIQDLDAANIAMGFGRYGDCSRLGVGYGKTKAGFGITPREQLFLYGLQDFADGSCVIWGTEMSDKYNYLLPGDKRETRARSHLFSATLTPTGEDTFDIEYVLQLEIGGNIPLFLTNPVMIDTVKSLFRVAGHEFGQGSEGPIGEYLQEKARIDSLENRSSLLLAV